MIRGLGRSRFRPFAIRHPSHNTPSWLHGPHGRSLLRAPSSPLVFSRPGSARQTSPIRPGPSVRHQGSLPPSLPGHSALRPPPPLPSPPLRSAPLPTLSPLPAGRGPWRPRSVPWERGRRRCGGRNGLAAQRDRGVDGSYLREHLEELSLGDVAVQVADVEGRVHKHRRIGRLGGHLGASRLLGRGRDSSHGVEVCGGAKLREGWQTKRGRERGPAPQGRAVAGPRRLAGPPARGMPSALSSHRSWWGSAGRVPAAHPPSPLRTPRTAATSPPNPETLALSAWGRYEIIRNVAKAVCIAPLSREPRRVVGGRSPGGGGKR